MPQNRLLAWVLAAVIGNCVSLRAVAEDGKKKPMTKNAFAAAIEIVSARNAAEMAKRVNALMKLRIRSIGRVCQLSDDQRKRLEVAAKSATKRYVRELIKGVDMNEIVDSYWEYIFVANAAEQAGLFKEVLESMMPLVRFS
ncbi:MAG: hypothetical protein O3A00_26240 [Planctomycetota bacterium]|nr:hypothetical protein [Planctomycetota bacterium]